MSDAASFHVQGASESPIILHVPHSSTMIPPEARESILLDDEQLAAEVRFMTDAHTAHLTSEAAEASGTSPWLFVNQLSRLVIDPERLPDHEEEMVSVGMGAVYTGTSHRGVLRRKDADRDKALRAAFFDPYAEALADLVDERLAATGRAVIIDMHSYPTLALPYELHQHDARPPVCLGVDTDHTSNALVQMAADALRPIGEVGLNKPFAGTYVPLRHYGREPRVESIMIELRRDIYMVEPGGDIHEGAADVVKALANLLRRMSIGEL